MKWYDKYNGFIVAILVILFIIIFLIGITDLNFNQGIRQCDKLKSYGFETVIEYNYGSSFCYVITKDGHKISYYDIDITAILDFSR